MEKRGDSFTRYIIFVRTLSLEARSLPGFFLETDKLKLIVRC